MILRIFDDGRDQGISVLGDHLDVSVHLGRILIVGIIGLDRRQLNDLSGKVRRQLSDRARTIKCPSPRRSANRHPRSQAERDPSLPMEAGSA
jgi:hypothetical protein